MARARNIKPGLFKNEDVAECTIWARYTFTGLWCLADREGRLEDRPKRIKGELFPFDSQDVEPLLAELAARGFIRRYVVHGVAYIQILNFLKHQKPHGTEKDSVIPDANGYLTVHERKGTCATGQQSLVLMHVNGVVTAQNNSDLNVKGVSAGNTNNSETTLTGGGLEGGHNALNPDSPIHRFTDSPNPEIKNTCEEPPSGLPADGAVTVVELLTNKGDLFAVTQTHIDSWIPAYPAVDIPHQLQEMRVWCDTHAAQRKTRTGMPRFITGWLSRAQKAAKAQGFATPFRSKSTAHTHGFNQKEYLDGHPPG